jgi:hypothetical protein
MLVVSTGLVVLLVMFDEPPDIVVSSFVDRQITVALAAPAGSREMPSRYETQQLYVVRATTQQINHYIRRPLSYHNIA